MKQARVSLVMGIFFMVCVSAGAQISFSAWGRAVITPLAFMEEHSAVSAATSTWGDVPSIGFSAKGTAPSGNIGFNIDFDFGINIANNNSPAIIGDNAKAWVKPLGLLLPNANMLKLTAGWFKEEEFRGKIGASEFASWLLPNGGKGEDNIFQRFDASAGAHVKLEPLIWLDSPYKELNIQLAFGSNALGAPGNSLRAIYNLLNNEDNNTIADHYDESLAYYDGDRTMSIADVYKAMQIAVGYKIPDVGFARVQFIGNNRNVFRWSEQNNANGVVDLEKKLVAGMNTNRDADTIEAAFLYDGIAGLIIDVGAKIPMEYTTKANFEVYPRKVGSDGKIKAEIQNKNHAEYTVQLPYTVAVGASWTPSFLKSLNLIARVDTSFGGTIESETAGVKVSNGYALNVWFMPSYVIVDNFKVGFDMGFDVHGLDTLWQKGVAVDEAQTDVSKYIDFGIGPWFELGVGGGRVRTGIVVMVPGSARYKTSSSPTYTYGPLLTGEPVVSVPVSFTYSF